MKFLERFLFMFLRFYSKSNFLLWFHDFGSQNKFDGDFVILLYL